MKKILIAEFKHETNSFAPKTTNETEFRNRDYLFGEDVIRRFRGMKNELGAFIDCFQEDEDAKIVPAMAFNAQPGGIVARAVFDTAVKCLEETLDRENNVNGILLALHGAMVVEQEEDGEGKLLEILRKKVGFNIPIIASLDLHANVTQKMMANADAFFPFDYYPHTDTYDAGMRAALCMRDTLLGKIKPCMRYCKLDFLMPYMPTVIEPMKGIVAKAQSFRMNGKILNVNVCHGFFAADIYEQGVSVLAVTDNDPDLAQRVADDIGGQIWDNRKHFKREFTDLDDAIDELNTSCKHPLVFADVADNPGSGATGDTTVLLRRLIERNVQDVAFAIIYDPETVEQAEKAGVGSTIDVKLGGKQCPDIGGGPICEKAYVKLISDGVHYTKDFCPGTICNLGKTAVLIINGIEILTTSVRTQAWDLEAFRSNGIMPELKRLLVVKSAAHFRASYGTIANKIIDIELPAIAPQNPSAIYYKHTRRPIYPLDDM